MDGNLGSELHYEPNSYGNWIDQPKDNLPKESGGNVYRYDFREDDHDYFTLPGLFLGL